MTVALSDQQFEKLLQEMRRPEGQAGRMSLLESNRKLDSELTERFMKSEIEDIRETYGVDITDRRYFDFCNPGYNWGTFRESCKKLSRKLRFREVNAASTFGQLFRVGAQTIANEWYQKTDVTYKSWIQEVTSNKRQEWYPPMYKASPPRRMGAGEVFPEQRVTGTDLVMINYKAGGILAFERELWDDDQTGQIQRRIADGAENMAVMEEAWAYARFLGAATTYGDDPITASQTKPSYEATWPWVASTAPFVGGGYNRPGTYIIFNQTPLIAAWQQLYNQLDGLGYKMLVKPDTILVSRIDKFGADILMNSQWYPSVPSGTAGVTGTNFAKNAIQGLANVVTSRFMKDYSWALGESGKGMIFQRRDPVEVVMEAPNSGKSFDEDAMRGRTRSRWEVDWISPLFWYLGDDGSVTS